MEFLKVKPREYQEKIYEKCMEKNCLVVLPTGLGKTLIALMLTIGRMKEFPGEKVVFLAPTKPLAEQHLASFKKNLPELFGEMQLFTGKVNAQKRKKIWDTADIIFSTPQCVANDLKKKLYDLSEVCLLVEDEAHRCLKNYDYNYIAKKYQEQAQHQRLLGLTASPGSDVEKIKGICRNLNIEELEVRTRESEDVKKYLQEVDYKKELVNFPPEFLEIKHVLNRIYEEYISKLKESKLIFGQINKISLLEAQRRISFTISQGGKHPHLYSGASNCAQAIKILHGIELLETQTLYSFNQYLKKLFSEASQGKSRGISQLVSKPEFNFAFMRSNELISKEVEHPKLERVTEIIKGEIENDRNFKAIIFTQFRDTATIISDKINNIPKIKSKVFVGQAKKGSGKNETGLNQKEQQKIIEEFSSGEINVLCATSIAEEGLDIPEVNAVIFYEPISSAIRKIQRSGRTARLSEGKVIMIITRGTRDESSYYVSKSREKKMYSEIEKVKEEIKREGKINKEQKQTKLGF